MPIWHGVGGFMFNSSSSLRMARDVCEWATRGGERRNTAAYDKGISLGVVCRTILGVSVNDAGSIFWCARAPRRLVYSAAQRARRAVSSLAQWQRPRMWIYVAAPHHTTKPSWGGDAHAGLKRTPGFRQNKVPAKKVMTEKTDLDRGCRRLRSWEAHPRTTRGFPSGE